MRDDYPIVVFWWEEDREWVGDVPDPRESPYLPETARAALRAEVTT